MENEDHRTSSPNRTATTTASSSASETCNQDSKDQSSSKKVSSGVVTPVHDIKPIISITPVISSPMTSAQRKSSPVPCIGAGRNSPSLGSTLLAHSSSSGRSRKTASPMVSATSSVTASALLNLANQCQTAPVALTTTQTSSPLCLVTNGKVPQHLDSRSREKPSTEQEKQHADRSESDSHTGASSDASVCSDPSHESGEENGGRQKRPVEASAQTAIKHNSSRNLAENIEKLHQKHQEQIMRYNLDGKVNMGFPIGLSSSITLTPVAPPSPPLNAPLNLSMKPATAPPSSNSGSFYDNVISLNHQAPPQPYKGAKRGPKPKHLKAGMMDGVNHIRQRQEELAHFVAQLKMHEMQRTLDQTAALNFMSHQLTPPRVHIQTSSVGRGKSVVITTTSPSSSLSQSPNSRSHHHQHHHHRLSDALSAASKSRTLGKSVSLLASNKLLEMPSTSVQAHHHHSRSKVGGSGAGAHSKRPESARALLGNGTADLSLVRNDDRGRDCGQFSHSMSVESYDLGGSESRDKKIVAKFRTLEGESSAEDSSDDDSSGETADSSCDSDTSGGESEPSTSDTDRSRETTSSTSKGKKRDYSSDSTPSRKRRKYIVSDERELRIPLEHGWRRLTKIRTYSFSGVRGEVVYYGPCGKKLKTYPEVVRYLEKNGITDITRENFTFSSKHNVGEFLEPQGNGQYLTIGENDVISRIEEFRVNKGKRYAPVSQRRLDKRRQHAAEKQRRKEEARLQRKIEEQAGARKTREVKRRKTRVTDYKATKRTQAAEARRQKEHLRFLRQQERMERQEQQRVDKESKAHQILEARRRRQELLEKQRIEENVRKNKERELKRLQAVVLREQELQKRREMLIMVDLERERRRQHMLLVKALETRKRQEERERVKEERINEKKLNRERKLEQRRMEMHMIREMKKPVEDMELVDAQSLPALNRIPGVKLAGKAFADILMVFEFLHNFGETLGFDMDSLPTLNTLQMALLNDEGCEEELLSVLHHLLICAIDDPGLPQGIKGTTAVGQSLKEVDITSATVSEILRIYIHANEGEKCKMLDWIAQKPFIALTPTQKAAIVAYLCNELLCSRTICRQIDNNIETVNGMRRDKWVAEGKVRQLKMLQAKKIAHRELKMQQKEEKKVEKASVSQGRKENVCDEGSPRDKQEARDDNEEMRNDSGNESEEFHHSVHGEIEQELGELEDEVPGETVEDLGKKIDKVTKQQNLFRRKLLKASQQLRAISLGQDRYRRRYWLIPHGGGVFVEGLESAELQEDNLHDCNGANKGENEIEQLVNQKTVDGVEHKLEQQSDDTKENCERAPIEVKKECNVPLSVSPKVKLEKDEDVATPKHELKIGDSVKTSDICPQNTNQVKKQRDACDKTEATTTPKVEVKEEVTDVVKPQPFSLDTPPSIGIKDSSARKLTDCDSEVNLKRNQLDPSQNGSFAPSSGLFPTIPQYQVCAEQILRTLTEQHNQQQQPWFSLLPRMPCDETSLTRIHSTGTTPARATPKTQQNSSAGREVERASVSSPFSNTANPNHVSIPHYSPFYFHSSPASMGFVNGTLLPYFVPPHYLGRSSGSDFGSPYMPCSNGPIASQFSAGSPGYGYGHPSPIDPSILEQYTRHQEEQRRPQEAKPIPLELQKGWWRITDGNQLKAVAHALHPRGIREKMLHLKLQKYLDIACDVFGKASHNNVIDLEITDLDREISQKPGGAPEADRECEWSRKMALRADMTILEHVENMEEKIASASMQIKNWKLPPKITDDDNIRFHPSCEKPLKEATDNDKRPLSWLCPLTAARQRLLDLEENIERRYIKPPLGYSTGQVNINSMNANAVNATGIGSTAVADLKVVDEENGKDVAEEVPPSPVTEEVPEGLLRWRAAVQKTRTSSQLAVCLNFLESCIAWDRSIMKASCQFCNSGDNEAMLLLCDGCDKGYHTYCFKPKMETIPEGDWFCYECRNKATGDRLCLFCGKKGKNICSCDNCPKAFHIECMEPPMARLPKGRWVCSHCIHKSSKGKGKSRKSKDSKDAGSDVDDVLPRKSEKASKVEKVKERNKVPVSKDLELCRVVLAELETHEDAWPFLLPVNTKQFPSYRKVIKKPMDLSTIHAKLENGSYKSRGDFLTNVRLMFDNCETFNEDDSPVGKAGHSLRAYFETRWFDVADK